MSMIAKDSGNEFIHAPVGTHPARCYQIIDLGHQKSEYEGQLTIGHKILVSFELPLADRMPDGRPIAISKFYTLSLNDKANLCADLTAWRGKAFTETEKEGFDVTKLIGVTCMLSIVQKNGKSKISGVMGVPQGINMPDQINESVVFDLDAFLLGKKDVYNNLTEGLQGLIKKSQELSNPDEMPSNENVLADPVAIDNSPAPVKSQLIKSPYITDYDDDIPF